MLRAGKQRISRIFSWHSHKENTELTTSFPISENGWLIREFPDILRFVKLTVNEGFLAVIIQNEVFLSEAEAHQCIWSATVNWQGGIGKNIEIDILQENRNRDIKKQIKSMGANKTNAAIERASRSTGVKEKLLKILIRRSGKERNLLHMPTALQL